MTPEQLELVGSTLTDVGTHSEAFSACFYEQLFASAPETRLLFPDDIDEQGDKLVAELLFLAGVVSDLPRFVAHARELGARHHRHGVRPGHYEVVEHAILSALADALGPEWNESTLLAWQRLYRLMAETMLEGSCGGAFVGPAVIPPVSES